MAVGIVIGIIGLLFWGLGLLLERLSAVLLPIAAALILAYILDPVVEFLVRKKVPRTRAIVVVFLVGALLMAGLLASIVPGMMVEARRLIDDLPENTQILRGKVEALREKGSRFGIHVPSFWPSEPAATKGAAQLQTPKKTNNETEPKPEQTNAVELNLSIKVKDDSDTNDPAKTNEATIAANTDDLKRALDSPFSEAVMPGMTKALTFIAKWITAQLGRVTTWIEFVIGFVLVPVYMFYFLLEKKGIKSRWTDYLPIQESKVKEEKGVPGSRMKIDREQHAGSASRTGG
jgi:predicted PurR-regulated permease PerM